MRSPRHIRGNRSELATKLCGRVGLEIPEVDVTGATKVIDHHTSLGTPEPCSGRRGMGLAQKLGQTHIQRSQPAGMQQVAACPAIAGSLRGAQESQQHFVSFSRASTRSPFPPSWPHGIPCATKLETMRVASLRRQRSGCAGGPARRLVFTLAPSVRVSQTTEGPFRPSRQGRPRPRNRRQRQRWSIDSCCLFSCCWCGSCRGRVRPLCFPAHPRKAKIVNQAGGPSLEHVPPQNK